MTLLLAPLFAAPLLTTPLVPQEPAPAAKQEEGGMPSCDGKDEIVLPSGLKFCVLASGDATQDAPNRGDKVRMHYTGWLLDGTEFDSSRKARRPGMPVEPFEFTVGSGVIDGWSEIAQQMKVGDRFRVTIPSKLGYGEQGSGATIPPNADLVFDMKLMQIVERAVGFEAWPEAPKEDELVELAGGVKLRVVKKGDGPAVSEVDHGEVRFACYNPGGGYVFGDTERGYAPLTMNKNPMRGGLPWFDSLRTHLRAGAVIQCNAPSAAGLGAQGAEIPGLPKGSNEIWMFECTKAMSFEKPTFQMPADDVLTTTDSGLKFVVTREGDGQQPTAANSVVAHYAGWLTTGSPFDNSYDRGAPSTFPLSRVVRGWTEGLQHLKAGGAGWFVIPPELGYGAANKPGIPPNSTLVFYVELVDVK